jgi:hypothetical protein
MTAGRCGSAAVAGLAAATGYGLAAGRCRLDLGRRGSAWLLRGAATADLGGHDFLVAPPFDCAAALVPPWWWDQGAGSACCGAMVVLRDVPSFSWWQCCGGGGRLP